MGKIEPFQVKRREYREPLVTTVSPELAKVLRDRAGNTRGALSRLIESLLVQGLKAEGIEVEGYVEEK